MRLRSVLTNNLFLLRHCRDAASMLALKGHPRLLPDGSRYEVSLRGLPRPLLCRAGSSDHRVIWEVFCNAAYQPRGPWWFASVLDCGANCGMFAAWARLRSGSRPFRYVGVEPDPSSFAALREQIARLGPGVTAELHEVAVAVHSGSARFDISGASWAHRLDDRGGLEVRTRTVGEILDAAGLEQVDLMKLDIEGGERTLLEALPEFGPRVKAIVAELHEELDFDWFAARAKRAGFVPFPTGQWFRGLPSALREDQLAAHGPRS
jgi:FkbM family methyltransferase